MRKLSVQAFASVVALIAATASCSSTVVDAASEADETEPVAATDDGLQSAISCALRRDTAYNRGTPSTIEVMTIGGKPVARATGHAFLRMQKAADAAGVYLAITSGFRTMAEQRYLYDCYRSGRCNSGNLAAPPGYSNHQNGLALDLTTSSWLANNASRFGFVRTVPSESWHYEYVDGIDPGGPCGGGAVGWVSPREGGWYRNGIWLKVSGSNAARRVAYSAGSYALGESEDASQDFALRYVFNTLGERTVTARVFDAAGVTLGTSSITFRVVE
jgi:D-alanyl-D-alanine dipeptidase